MRQLKKIKKNGSKPSKKAYRLVSAPLHPEAACAKIVRDHIAVTLKDGRSLFIPTVWQPDVHNATPAQKQNIELIGGGSTLFWPDMDLYVSVRRLLVPDGDCC